MKLRRLFILSAAAALMLTALTCCTQAVAPGEDGASGTTEVSHTEVSYSEVSLTDSDEPFSETENVTETETETAAETPPPCATVQLAGDVLIHDSVYSNARVGEDKYDFTPYFSEFGNVFTADLSVINLENPVDAYGGNKGLSSYPSFNCPREILPALRQLGVDMCTLSNNHAFDQELAGVRSTISLARAEGLDTVGTYSRPGVANELYIKEINGINIGICAFTEHLNGVYVPDSAAYFTGVTGRGKNTDLDMMTSRVKALREAGADFVILCYHWGDEYITVPRQYQIKTAQKLCDAGVDVLAGSHSHCVMPIRWMTSTDGQHKMLTIYSMGNLFANQTSITKSMTRYGMVVSLKIKTGENGSAYIDDSFYMPTATVLTGGKNADFLRLCPAGQEQSDDRIGIICAEAYDFVCNTAGSEMTAVKEPGGVPEDFFEAQ